MRYWQVGSPDDTLSYYVYAPNREMAIKVVEDLTGPQNPSRRRIMELLNCPEGFEVKDLEKAQILEEAE